MVNWISALLEEGGYVALVFLMLLEALIPPIPSELIMPVGGLMASRGELHVVGVVIAGTLGSLLGAFLWYGGGRALGRERVKRFSEKHGRWLTLTPKQVDDAQKWFDRHGTQAVFFGRLVPQVRVFISLPAGIARMNLQKFVLWTSLGAALWNSILVGLAYWLADGYERIHHWFNPISTAIVVLLIGWYLYRVAKFKG
jgi:membrane protein DedA with SNARE-associated domain